MPLEKVSILLCPTQLWVKKKVEQTGFFSLDAATGLEEGKHWIQTSFALSTGAIEYTDCISAEGNANECHGYDTKQSDGEAPVSLELWGMRSTS